MEDLLSRPYDIRYVVISYVGLGISSVWHRHSIHISYGWLNNLSVWQNHSSYLIRMTQQLYTYLIQWTYYLVRIARSVAISYVAISYCCYLILYRNIRCFKIVGNQSWTTFVAEINSWIASHPHDIATVHLSHTDDLLTPPYSITTAVISYRRLSMSSVWHNNSTRISYVGLTNLSVWHEVCCYPIRKA